MEEKNKSVGENFIVPGVDSIERLSELASKEKKVAEGVFTLQCGCKSQPGFYVQIGGQWWLFVMERKGKKVEVNGEEIGYCRSCFRKLMVDEPAMEQYVYGSDKALDAQVKHIVSKTRA